MMRLQRRKHRRSGGKSLMLEVVLVVFEVLEGEVDEVVERDVRLSSFRPMFP